MVHGEVLDRDMSRHKVVNDPVRDREPSRAQDDGKGGLTILKSDPVLFNGRDLQFNPSLGSP